jgi:tRNA-uridine 2-sulfurtransferase
VVAVEEPTTGGGRPDRVLRLGRGADQAKDQSYVLYMLGQDELAYTLLPVGDLTKDQVRAEADRLGLRTASKPDSQDVCFITSTSGRTGFLGRRMELHPGTVVDAEGASVGSVDAVELVTLGQRRGLGIGGTGAPQYAVEVDVPRRTVRVGAEEELMVAEVELDRLAWADRPVEGRVQAQCSAHGVPRAAEVVLKGADRAVVRFDERLRRVAPGQSVVFYDGDTVLGGGVVAVAP